jgi:hypothetical protein
MTVSGSNDEQDGHFLVLWLMRRSTLLTNENACVYAFRIYPHSPALQILSVFRFLLSLISEVPPPSLPKWINSFSTGNKEVPTPLPAQKLHKYLNNFSDSQWPKLTSNSPYNHNAPWKNWAFCEHNGPETCIPSICLLLNHCRTPYYRQEVSKSPIKGLQKSSYFS